MYRKTFITIKMPLPCELAWSLETELFYILDGTMVLTVSGTSYELHSGDLLALNHFNIYSIQHMQGLCIQLSLDMKGFSEYCGMTALPALRLNTATNIPGELSGNDRHRLCEVRQYVHRILRCIVENESEPDLMRQKDEFNLLTQLIMYFSEPASGSPDQEKLLAEALEYIAAHYTEAIGVQDIATYCHISNAYLAHLFQSALSLPPSVFLTKTRLQYVKKLLKQSKTLTQIAAAAGFGTARNMNAAFLKAYGCTPGEYRKDALHVGSPDLLADTEKRLRHWLDAHPDKHSAMTHDAGCVSAAAEPCFHLPEQLLALLELGSAHKLLNTGYRSVLEKCQARLDFRYIHLYGIFDNTLLAYKVTEGDIEWDFTNLDQVFEYVISIGLTPVITISSIPNVLSVAGSNTYFGFSNVSYPADIPGWRSLLHSFINHLLLKFGRDQLHTWKIGIHFLPSCMFAAASDCLTEMEYIRFLTPLMDLYMEAFHIFREFCPEIAIGCPEGDIGDLLRFDGLIPWMSGYFREHGCIPDYFPFHDEWNITDKSIDDGQAVISDCHISITDTADQTSRLCKLVKKCFNEKIAIYCTSFSFFYNILNETVYAASVRISYILRNASLLDMVGVGPCSDSPAAYRNNVPEFYGGRCFMTVHHIRRPFYYAFLELCKLQSPVLYADDHSFITGSHGKMTLIFWNTPDFAYRLRIPHKAMKKMPIILANEDYYAVGTDEPLFADTLNAGNKIGKTPLDICILLENLLYGNYLVESVSINTQHGSAYDEWLREGAYSKFGPDDYAYLNGRALPARLKKIVTIADGMYRLKSTLEPGEIRIFRLTPEQKE